MIPPEWRGSSWKNGINLKKLNEILCEAYTEDCWPKRMDVFNAFSVQPKDVSVVIVGQDPYRSEQATGYAFLPRDAVPGTYRNILREMQHDIGEHTSLGIHHVNQGVLLLNAALTVPRKAGTNHKKLWRPFLMDVVTLLNLKDDIVWMLWGNDAQSLMKYIGNPTHDVLIAPHPSPQTCGAFFGSKPFSKCNEIFSRKGLPQIKW